MKPCLILVIFFFTEPLVAQPSNPDYVVAKSFFNSGNYKRASELLLKLYSNNPTFESFYLDMLRSSLFKSRNYKVLIPILKRVIKNQDNRFTLKLQLFECFVLERKKASSDSLFALLEEIALGDQGKSNLLIISLSKNALFEKLITLVKKIRSLTKKPHAFHFEYVRALLSKKLFFDTTSELIFLYDKNQRSLSEIQELILSYATDKNSLGPTTQALNTIKTSKYSRNTKFYISRILLELLVEVREYRKALSEAEYQDALMRYNGNSVLDFAQMVTNKKQFSFAKEAYQKVVENSEVNFNIHTAKLGLARISKLEIEMLKDSLRLKKSRETIKLYQDYINNAPESPETHSEALYYVGVIQAEELNQTEEAIATFRKLFSRYPYSKKAQQAPIYFVTLFAKIDSLSTANAMLERIIQRTSSKTDLAAKARYKMAEIAFLSKNFLKSLSISSIIPTNTSSSNDALLFRTFLIKAMKDTLKYPKAIEALRSYSDIKKAVFQKDDPLKIRPLFKTWIATHSKSAILENMLFLKANFEKQVGDTLLSAQTYITLSEKYPQSYYAEKSIFNAASLLEKIKPSESSALYEKLLFSFPNSLYKRRARSRILKISKLITP